MLKVTSVDSILAKVARTFKPPDSSWINDAIEDIGWGIQAIGYHSGFHNIATKYPYLTVEHHRAKIPCEFEEITAVERLRITNRNNHILNSDGTTPEPEEDEESCPPNYKGVKMTKSSDITMSSMSETSPRTIDNNVDDLMDTYSIDGGYVVTQFQSGLIKLYGIGFPVDDNGLPCVVDNFEYRTCLEWYVVSQMILRGYKNPEISYQLADAKFSQFIPKAQNSVKDMGLDTMENFEASWLRFSKGFNHSGNYFAGLEQREYIGR